MAVSRKELVDLAISEGLDLDEAEALSDDELKDMLDRGETEEDAYQDQGSLDDPIQSTAPIEAPADIGTAELRDEAAARVGSRREPFPWEVGPPQQG